MREFFKPKKTKKQNKIQKQKQKNQWASRKKERLKIFSTPRKKNRENRQISEWNKIKNWRRGVRNKITKPASNKHHHSPFFFMLALPLISDRQRHRSPTRNFKSHSSGLHLILPYFHTSLSSGHFTQMSEPNTVDPRLLSGKNLTSFVAEEFV